MGHRLYYDEDETGFHELNYDQYDLMMDIKYMEFLFDDEARESGGPSRKSHGFEKPARLTQFERQIFTAES